MQNRHPTSKPTLQYMTPGVGAVDFLKDGARVFLGDEHGYIRSYCVEGVISKYGKIWDGVEHLPPPNARDFKVQLVDEWHAHDDSIRTLSVIQSLKVVLTGSYDQRVLLHSDAGQYLVRCVGSARALAYVRARI